MLAVYLREPEEGQMTISVQPDAGEQMMTLRMFGDNITLPACAWRDLLDELRPDADLAQHIHEMLAANDG